jgi:hypothetical protein
MEAAVSNEWHVKDMWHVTGKTGERCAIQLGIITLLRKRGNEKFFGNQVVRKRCDEKVLATIWLGEV